METIHTGNGFTVGHMVTGPLENNVYLVTCKSTGSSLIIDAASDPDAVAEAAKGTRVTAVVTTHGHWDHHGAIPTLTERLSVPFMLHTDDVEIAGKVPDVPLVEGVLNLEEIEAEVIHTPGHTPGSVCILLDGVLFSGDTLFPGGPGATHNDHSSFNSIIDSIETRLFTLPDDTIVLPGHGAPTIIGSERPQLPLWVERGW